MAKEEPFSLYDEDALESYLVWRKQAMEVHLVLGTQRLLELDSYVSDMRSNNVRKSNTQYPK
jgi:hypothetical protein